MFKRLSSVLLKKHSEQQSEDELDSTSGLDSTYLFLSGTGLSKFQSAKNHLKTATSMLRKKIFANLFV